MGIHKNLSSFGRHFTVYHCSINGELRYGSKMALGELLGNILFYILFIFIKRSFKSTSPRVNII